MPFIKIMNVIPAASWAHIALFDISAGTDKGRGQPGGGEIWHQPPQAVKDLGAGMLLL